MTNLAIQIMFNGSWQLNSYNITSVSKLVVWSLKNIGIDMEHLIKDHRVTL